MAQIKNTKEYEFILCEIFLRNNHDKKNIIKKLREKFDGNCTDQRYYDFLNRVEKHVKNSNFIKEYISSLKLESLRVQNTELVPKNNNRISNQEVIQPTILEDKKTPPIPLEKKRGVTVATAPVIKKTNVQEEAIEELGFEPDELLFADVIVLDGVYYFMDIRYCLGVYDIETKEEISDLSSSIRYLNALAINFIKNEMSAETEVEQKLLKIGKEQDMFGSRAFIPTQYKVEYSEYITEYYEDGELENVELIQEFEKGTGTRKYLDKTLNSYLKDIARHMTKDELYALADEALAEWSYPIEDVITRTSSFGITTLNLSKKDGFYSPYYVKQHIANKTELSKYFVVHHSMESVLNYKEIFRNLKEEERKEEVDRFYADAGIDVETFSNMLGIIDIVAYSGNHFCFRMLEDIATKMNKELLNYNASIIKSKLKVIREAIMARKK